MGEISKSFTTYKYEAIYSVDEEQSGLRLDQFCAIYLPTFSRELIKKKIAAGDIQIENRPYPHKPSVKVYYGEVIHFVTNRDDLEDEYWRGEKLDLEFTPTVIYEDQDIIAISKPAYMSTHPTGRHLFNCATVFFEEKYKHTVHSIHRIDRETSGVLLLGKNPKAAQVCTDYFERDLVSKCYFFMAHKRKEATFPLTANERLGPLENYKPRLFMHCFPENSAEGKEAQTYFECLYQNEDYILGLAFPRTGRQHQIRSHAAFQGFPLIGDKLYNGDPKVFMRFKDGIATTEDHDLMQLSRHALHATALKIPYQGGKLFRAPIPHDFREWITKNLVDCSISDLELKIDTLVKDLFKMV
jgi:23S rRNA pseudouridine1911/1915/1917 synthase